MNLSDEIEWRNHSLQSFIKELIDGRANPQRRKELLKHIDYVTAEIGLLQGLQE